MKGKGKGTADDIFKEINRKKSIAQTGRKMSVDPGQALLSNNVLLYSTANIVRCKKCQLTEHFLTRPLQNEYFKS